MLKLEIKIDEEKIKSEGKYTVEEIYESIDSPFQQCQITDKSKDEDGTITYYGSRNRDDYGYFGLIITKLKTRSWFMDYLVKWIWYNSDGGRHEEDYAMEDVLYHYTKKRSIV